MLAHLLLIFVMPIVLIMGKRLSAGHILNLSDSKVYVVKCLISCQKIFRRINRLLMGDFDGW